MIEALAQDVRFALRWLAKSPGFTLVAVLSLAFGIGFNSALFSIVDALLFRPLPVSKVDELVDVYTSGGDGDSYATSSYPDYLDLKARNTVFQDVLGHSAMFGAINLPDRSRLALGEVVTGNYFPCLGVKAALGRTLMPEDDLPGAPRALMVSHRYWRRELAASPSAIGSTLRLRGQTYTIVGVAPAAFSGMTPLLSPEIWLPVAHVEEVEPAGIQDSVPSPGAGRLDRRGQRWMFLKGRLKPGVSVENAGASLSVLMKQLADTYPGSNKDRRIAVKRTREVRLHPEADRLLVPISLGLMAAVGLVLLIACANVASMLLARVSARQKEISIRLAMGASRARLVSQLLTESVVMSFLGAGLGLAMAFVLTRAAQSPELPIPVPLSIDLSIDPRVLLFTFGLTLFTAVVAGLTPALKASKPDLVRDLRGEMLGASLAGRRFGLRDGLVAGQMAVAVVLLVTAGLLTRSLLASSRAGVGFRTSGLAIVSMDTGMLRYDDGQSRRFFEEALRRARTIPGAESAALAARLPFSINFNTESFEIPGYPRGTDGRGISLQTTRVSPDYFRALGVPILEGRAFSELDMAASEGAPRLAVINETMARAYWPGRSAIGQSFVDADRPNVRFEVVGVSGDHKVRTVGEAPTPYVHLSTTQRLDSFQILLVRTPGSARQALSTLKKELLALEPNLVFLDSQTMEDQVAATLFPVRASATLVAAVSLVALTLASIGLYGVIAYTVARRTKEIGIRMALGARPGDVLAMVMRQGLGVALVGLGVGVILAAAATQGLKGTLYGVGLSDPLSWLGSALTLLIVASFANVIPAMRASKVEPVTALRED